MAIIVCACASHSPGVTTTCLGLALQWPRPILLVDADRDVSRSLLATHLFGFDVGDAGLTSLLRAHRERSDLKAALPRQTISLDTLQPDSDTVTRAFLPGFSSLGSAALFGPVWESLMNALNHWPGDVIIDAGRLGVEGLPHAMVELSDALIVMTQSSLKHLAAVSMHVENLDRVRDDYERDVAMVVVGPGRPYSVREIERQFPFEIWGTVEWDVEGADKLGHLSTRNDRTKNSAYLRSLSVLTRNLAGRFNQPRRQAR